MQYQVVKTDGEVLDCDSPSQLPALSNVNEIREPYVLATILTPKDYVGNVITLCTQKRGTQKEMTYFGNQVSIVFEMPLAEVIIDFFDRLKSTTKGYASIEYNITEFKASNLIKLDVLLNNDVVDALSIIIHKDFAMSRGREVAKNLQKLIPRQMFDIPIQVALGSKIISRETVKALRKMLLPNAMVAISRVKRNCLKSKKKAKENETVWKSLYTARSVSKLFQFWREIMFGDPIFILSLLAVFGLIGIWIYQVLQDALTDQSQQIIYIAGLSSSLIGIYRIFCKCRGFRISITDWFIHLLNYFNDWYFE